mgnify:CR=1 FL=1
MSFMSDLGSFIGDIQSFSEQVDTVKQEVVSSVVHTVTHTTQIGSQLADDVANSVDDVKSVAASTTDEVKQTLNDK